MISVLASSVVDRGFDVMISVLASSVVAYLIKTF
jgi:hypothetical protein